MKLNNMEFKALKGIITEIKKETRCEWCYNDSIPEGFTVNQWKGYLGALEKKALIDIDIDQVNLTALVPVCFPELAAEIKDFLLREVTG
jgi:hypothetical protein